MSSLTPSDAQRRAIEAPDGPVLVVAGPGAGKTFCLIERIRYLIEQREVDPKRLCAFTFTNKAATEISQRLAALGSRAGLVRRGTIHAFCADLLREHGAEVGLRRGFGIADEDYQRAVLSRAGTPYRFQKNLLTRISQHRFQVKPLGEDDSKKLRRYEQHLKDRNVVDFDTLVLKVAALLEVPRIASRIQQQYAHVLVDEFQDLNPVQFEIVRQLAVPHGNIYGVGDDEQSIYSWAGADPRVFLTFINTFDRVHRIELGQNHRCPRQVVEVARRLIAFNGSLFDVPRTVIATRESAFGVELRHFGDDNAEFSWLLDDIRRDRDEHGLRWGDVAVLYRQHTMGNALEAEFLRGGVPCRMAKGRALADDPVVAYLIAALRVIAQPGDLAREAEFMRVVLPATLFSEARTRAEDRDNEVLTQLELLARERPRGSEDARKIRRGQYELQNLTTLAQRHHRLDLLVEELLSQRVGQYRSVLEERHDEFSDPASNPEVVALAERLQEAVRAQRQVVFAPMGGLELALRGMLAAARYRGLLLERRQATDPLRIGPDDVPSLGVALGLFKALQYLATREFTNVFRDFTAFDIEATGRDVHHDRIIEVAAVRVRDGVLADTFTTLVRPGCRIPAASTALHTITDAMVAGAPTFAEVWPRLRDFFGRDVVVAHNGHGYDFPMLRLTPSALAPRCSSPPTTACPWPANCTPGAALCPSWPTPLGSTPGRVTVPSTTHAHWPRCSSGSANSNSPVRARQR